MIRLIPDAEDEITSCLAWLSEVLTGWDETDLMPGDVFEDPAEAVVD